MIELIMEVFVTGGTGYNGKRLLSALVALRLGLVSVAQMVRALVRAVESPPERGTRRIVEVREIRRAQLD